MNGLRKIITNSSLAILQGIATNYSIEFLESDSAETLMAKILLFIPFDWMHICTEFKKQSDLPSMNKYVDDAGMAILIKARTGKTLTPKEYEFLTVGVNSEIDLFPPPQREITCFRGIYDDRGYVPGLRSVLNRPTSASFNISVLLESYVNFEKGKPPCCILEITIPAGSNVAYMDSEAQIVFPAGSEFEVLGKRTARDFYGNWNWPDPSDYTPNVGVYHLLFKGTTKDDSWKQSLVLESNSHGASTVYQKEIKTPLSPYLHFSAERRPQLEQEEPEMTPGDVAKQIKKEWKEMPSEEKQHWFDLAYADEQQLNEDN
jgi:hypothetical protein